MPKTPAQKTITTITHTEDKRKNIPAAEYQALVDDKTKQPIRKEYERRNRDLDPQLVWRGKDEQNRSELVIQVPPLYIQEKVNPKVIIDDLVKQSEVDRKASDIQIDLFADFNGIPEGADKTEFYRHDQNWSNRMILGDSLKVMASLSEREDLKGKVQCIYLDPPYGIKFNSNFQWSTTSRDVKDGNPEHISREPEQVKAFRDTWRDGIHSYLAYLRDRLTVARELLHESGSIFVQIGDENVHRVRALMDEVFGEDNFVCEILLKKGGTATSNYLPSTSDFILFYARNKETLKYRQLFWGKAVGIGESTGERYDQVENSDGKRRAMSKEEKDDANLIPNDAKVFKQSNPCSQHNNPLHREKPLIVEGKNYFPPPDRQWSTNLALMQRVIYANRIIPTGKNLAYVMYIDDYPVMPINNFWTDSLMRSTRRYIVETANSVIERCLLMTTDPGDLVLDPTCGSGTTAYVAEQWGRRWITIDTSRVALALARSRIMGARYPYYLLADSVDGQQKEGEITQTVPARTPTYGRIRQGFVYERVPHITLKSIANNTEIDVIWEKFQPQLEPIREQLNSSLKQKWQEWEIPREASKEWSAGAKKLHAEWWNLRIWRQKEIDASIAAKAEFEYLYDKPYEDKRKVRVAGPFTVESISPHRVLDLDENGDVITADRVTQRRRFAERTPSYGGDKNFTAIILENLKTAGVQQAHKDDKIDFRSLAPWPGRLICAEGTYLEGKANRRAAIFIGGEFGTVTRPDLVEAANEAAEANFDVLITCAFNYDAHSTEFDKLGKIKILKARMNADLHMADDLRNNGKGNLFVIFGEPDIEIKKRENKQIVVHLNGVDVFHPNTGKVESDNADGIACWFIDTDYNQESFFVRHAYFLGAGDPYGALKRSLKTEINEDAWTSLNSDESRPFDRPASGRIAVKVINHLGDEVMKVFKV
ncbi:restriction endonuclease subunit M [Spirochaetia bacterium]|nr:restriction endonuclease subunit M [Spirochaetia bacterium]